MVSRATAKRCVNEMKRRNQNVWHEESDSSQDSCANAENLNHSDDSDGELFHTKVRNQVSIRSLLRESKKFEVGDDHLYSRVKSEVKTDCVEKNRNNYNTRASNKMKRRVEDEDEEPVSQKKQRCSSKNAVMARLNRERKKRYISSLEKMVGDIKTENEMLLKKTQEQDQNLKKYKHEVAYLKSLLANSKELCSILCNVTKNTGLPITSSLLNTKTVKEEINNKGESVKIDEEMTGVNQPRTMTVSSGPNHPVAFKDVSLGYNSETDTNYLSDLGSYIDDHVENSLLSFENENFDLPFSEPLNFDLKSSIYPELPNFDDEIISDDFNLLSDVGICLHISKQKVSVELCAYCNDQANALI